MSGENLKSAYRSITRDHFPDSMEICFVQDGRRFIEGCANRYDVIFLDAFGAENIPYDLATREFLDAVRKALTPRGVVVGNLWSVSNPLYHSMVRTYQEVFDEVHIVDVRGAGNRILVALPRKRGVTRDGWARRSAEISRQHAFPFDMGRLVTAGHYAMDEKESRGHVLIDENKSRETAVQ